MITGVNEILGVINNLHHRIAVYSQLNAVFGGLGILDDLLGAVLVDDDRNRAGVHVGNRDLDLRLTCVLRQLDLDGRGGIAVLARLDLGGHLDRHR